eukprot:gene3720-4641_t
MKKELQMRLAIAGFLQEALQALADKKKKNLTCSEDQASAQELIEFMEKARSGLPLPNETVIRMAKLFKDELTLANIARPQLVTMCRFMGLPPYGTDALLRFQLRTKLRAIKEDDRRILWEGLDSLTLQELREACLTKRGYLSQLDEWLNLSIQKNIPISLLIMSRAFAISSAQPEDVLRDSLTSLNADLVNEVVLEAAKSEEEGTVEMRRRKLKSLEFQKELIKDEQKKSSPVVNTLPATAATAPTQTTAGPSSGADLPSTSSDTVVSAVSGEGAPLDAVSIEENLMRSSSALK